MNFPQGQINRNYHFYTFSCLFLYSSTGGRENTGRYLATQPEKMIKQFLKKEIDKRTCQTLCAGLFVLDKHDKKFFLNGLSLILASGKNEF